MAGELAGWIEYLKSDKTTDQLPPQRVDLLNLLTKAQADLHGVSYNLIREKEIITSDSKTAPIDEFLKT